MATVPEIKGELRRTPLAGGRGANEVLRITTANGDFVLRRRLAPVDRPGALALQELTAHRLAAAAGLAPRLVDYDPQGHWLLMEYVPDDPWTAEALDGNSHVEVLGQRLAEVHALPVSGFPTFDPLAIAEGQVEQIARAGGAGLDEAGRLRQSVASSSALLASLAGPAVLNHGDLQLSNVLGPQALLIDWEYAQRVDPVWDVACLLSYYPHLQRRQERLMAAAQLVSPEAGPRLAAARELFAALDGLWRLATGAA